MEKVLLGMSGGVDSSVAAIELKKQGYEVIGATMLLLGEEKSKDILDAKKVCEKLKIPHYVIDFKEKFRKCVINDFIENYKNAKTPNPCIECNKHIKFGALYEKSKELGCKYIATGHYAKIEFNKEYNQYVIKKIDSNKDQTYVLYNIKKEIIPHILFPLANFENKEKIRKIAEANDLNVAKKPDSQEICFISDNNYVRFLEENSNKKFKPGNIVNLQGEILGIHKGLINYTIGQRKGLGISNKTPLFVIKLDIEKNEVLVGEEKEIFSNELFAREINYTIDMVLKEPMEITAKIRYSAKEAKAKLYSIEKDLVKIKFEKPQRAITPGQSVVFYNKDVLIGGGKII